ncbi:MAG: glycosyltransferase family 2 protein [Paenibacillaceae bacterium]
MKDTLIIIPAYNEENGINAVLTSLVRFEDRADVLVVNDGSMDRTTEIVRQHQVFLISHPINLGYGAALQTAFRFANLKGYKYIVQFDADGQHHFDDLHRLIEEMHMDTDDVVIGSRVLGDPQFALGVRKRIAFLWFNSMIRLLTGMKVTDSTSGLRGLSRRTFSYYATSTSFPNDFPDADTIIHMFYEGFRIREVPIRSRARLAGISMHTGLLKNAVYMLKVTTSILAVLVYHLIFDRRKV